MDFQEMEQGHAEKLQQAIQLITEVLQGEQQETQGNEHPDLESQIGEALRK